MFLIILTGHAVLIPVLAIVTLGGNPGTNITIGGEPALLGNHRGTLLLFMLGWWVLAAAGANGIWKRRRWARHAMASVLFLVIAFGGIQGVYLRDTLMIVLAALLSLWTWWYFYRKESVTQYFNPGLRAGEDRQFQSAVSEELDRTLGSEVKDA